MYSPGGGGGGGGGIVKREVYYPRYWSEGEPALKAGGERGVEEDTRTDWRVEGGLGVVIDLSGCEKRQRKCRSDSLEP